MKRSPWSWTKLAAGSLPLSLSLVLSACPAPDVGDDAGITDPGKNDGGDVNDPDAGTTPDAGDVGDDDAGEPDAGEPDAGTPTDGGDPDAGTPDAGPPADPTNGFWSGDYILPGALGFGARVTAAVHASGETFYIAGTFTTVDGVRASNVAVWTGTQFVPVGEGLPGYVNTLAIGPNGELYAAGDLIEDWEQPEQIMKWENNTWTALPGDLDDEVKVLHVLEDGTLLVGGRFTDAGGTGVAGLAQHDGTGFSAFRGGGTEAYGEVAVIHEDPVLGVCVGGLFSTMGTVAANNVACHDGTAWAQLGDGTNSDVWAMTRDGNGDLIIGGRFSFFNEEDPFASVAGLGRLEEGVFVPHAGGVGGGGITSVRTLLPLPDNKLLVGGSFAGAGMGEGSIFSPHMALLTNGTTWSPPDENGAITTPLGIFLPGVEGLYTALPLADGRVFVGGYFTRAGSVLSGNIAFWDDFVFTGTAPANKEFLGVNGVVNELEPDRQGGFYLGGSFEWSGTVQANNIARYSVAGYEALGQGLDGAVNEILVLGDGSVLVGGDFFMPVGTDTPIPFLARWANGQWSAFGPAPDGPVNALALDHDGSLLVGGRFTHIGDVAVNRIARITPEGVQALGAGFGDAETWDSVNAIAVDSDGAILAGGQLGASGDTPINGVARFDGSAWQSVGGGIDNDAGWITMFDTYGEDILVGGSFDVIGGVQAKGLARWDGEAYSEIGGGLQGGYMTAVSGTDVWGPYLFATGLFETVGVEQADASFLAFYDGTDWRALGSGLGDIGEAVLVWNNSLVVAGAFQEAGGAPSIGLARWMFSDD